MHEYPIQGMKMPTFVTEGVQMVVEVNYAPGDRFQIGYKSIDHQTGPKIPRTRAQSTTLSPLLMPFDFNVSPDPYPRTTGYGPTENGVELINANSMKANPGLQFFGSSGSFGQNSPISKNLPQEQISPVNPRGWSFPESSADESVENPKNNKRSLIVGLLWTGGFLILLTGVSAVIYIRHQVSMHSSRRRTEQRLEAKL